MYYSPVSDFSTVVKLLKKTTDLEHIIKKKEKNFSQSGYPPFVQLTFGKA